MKTTTPSQDSIPSVEPRARPFCAYCRFYVAPSCRRNAPQATFQNDAQSRRAQFELTWPRVRASDWCGEWETTGTVQPIWNAEDDAWLAQRMAG